MLTKESDRCGYLPMAVHNALRRAGGPRREDDDGLCLSIRSFERNGPFSALFADASEGPAADALPGDGEGSSKDESGGHADDVPWACTSDGPTDTPDAQAGIGDDDARADRPAGVDNREEVGSRRNEHRHAVACLDAPRPQPSSESLDPIAECLPGDSAASPTGRHLGQGGLTRSHIAGNEQGVEQ